VVASGDMAVALEHTTLHARHVALGARMGAFAGWEMPLLYGSASAEHRAVRERCGVFDVSHMGQLQVSGPGARDALARLLTNDISAIGPGQGQYTLMCEDDGGVIDDLIVYALADRYLLVVNAANVDACRDRLDERLPPGVALADLTADVAMLALQGPRWADALLPLAATPLAATLDYFDVGEDVIAGVPCLIARTGYTGEPGVELMCPAEGAPDVWDALADLGDAAPAPAGLVARDTLRLEMGYPLHGQDLSVDTSPVEARLGWAVKGSGFRGEDAYRRVRESGAARRLMGLRLTGRGVPRAHCAVHRGDLPVGETTSGTFSPTLRLGIAMAYLDADVEVGDAVDIEVRGKRLPAEVVRPPFVDADPKG
jgi:aminomethyltransferase